MDVRPNRVRLDASTFCQLRCPACPTTTGAIDATLGGGFLKAADFERFLDASPSVRSVELSNQGEIFLNPELPRILEIAHRRGVATAASNGVNLSSAREPSLEAVVKFGVRAMTCSIDGASAEVYRRYRVRGRFDKVLDAIRTINRYKQAYKSEFPRLTWQFVAFEHNIHEIDDARAMAAALGMTFKPKLSWTDEGLGDGAEKARQTFGVERRSEFREREGRDVMQGICLQLWGEPQINWDGRVLGCCRNFWGDFGANAFDVGLDEAANSPAMRRARRMLRGQSEPCEGIPCATCDIYLTMRETGRYMPFSAVGLSPLRQRLRRAARWARLGLASTTGKRRGRRDPRSVPDTRP